MSAGNAAAESREAITDLEIQQWVEESYGFVPHPFWIGHCRTLYLGDVSSSEQVCKPWHECPMEKRTAIREAFAHFRLLPE